MEATIQDRLFKSFDKYSNKVAIEYRGGFLKYSEVDKKSNIIANTIIKKGIKAGSFIGILVEDRIETICIIIGILKAGCIFVPFDSIYPTKRLEAMVLSTDIDYFFTDKVNNHKIEEISQNNNRSIEKVLINKEFYDVEDLYYKAPLLKHLPEDAVYIFFTSGSTGIPKAIIGKNKSILHFITWEVDILNVSEDIRVSQLTSPGFDAILRDIFVPLCSGGVICIPDRREIILDSNSLCQWIEQSKINLVHCTPSLFKSINSNDINSNSYMSLKYILMAGEPIQPQSLSKWYNIIGERIQLVNLYGPSETTMVKVFYMMSSSDVERKSMPIGKPMSGCRVIILDEDMNPCVQGTVGEIYIRTPYITHGYHNNVELQNEKFIQNPFNDNPKDIIYRTGDLGRFLSDGNIEFLGRIDRQVKIRGVRLELGEIENVLLAHENIIEAVVVKKQTSGGNDYLCAYIIEEQRENSIENKKEKYKGFLLERLPDYMMPSNFVFMEVMPVTTNGKLDYKALPEPIEDNNREIKKPGNELEETLHEIWCDLLGMDEISVDSGFVEMGGHSLNAMTLIFRVFNEFEVELPLSEVLNDCTIESIGRFIRTEDKSKYMIIEPVEERDYYPVSSAQKRMFILNQLEGSSTNYNVSLALNIEHDFDIERFQKSIKALVQRHEAFRTSFHMVDGEPVQRINNDIEFEIQYSDATLESINQIVQDFIKPFNLGDSTLLRVNLIKLSKDRHVLVCDMHHIICDGLSVDILINEFIDLYLENELPEIRIQYKDYAVWQNNLFETDIIKEQEKYWLNRFSGDIPSLNIPTDYKRPLIQSFDGNTISFKASKELTKGIKKSAEDNRVTIYVFLLSIYKILLSKYASQEELVVGTPIAGRSHSEAEKMIGMFVNTLALKTNVTRSYKFSEFLLEVRKNVLNAFDNQDIQFEKLLDLLNIQRDLGRNPLFDVVFQLRNLEPSEKEIDSLKISAFEFENKTAKFDISLFAFEGMENIFFNLDYCTKLFKDKTANRMATHFINIIEQVIKKPNITLSEIELVTEEEKNTILNEFNNTQVEYPKYRTLHHVFEQQVEKHPNSTALIYEGIHLTYDELNQRSNQLARVLREKSVKQGTVVALMVERSFEMIVGIMAILKSGAAYLPISPQYPSERIKYIINDSGATILLTRQQYVENIELEIDIQNLDDSSIDSKDNTNLDIDNKSEDLAYVIYTSGSTGNPKGVMIEHGSIINRLQWMQNKYPLNEKDTILQKTPYTFDVSVWELFWWSFAGAKVCFLEQGDEKDSSAIVKAIEKNQITTIHFVPSMLNMFLEYVNELKCEEKLTSLRQVFASGEALSAKLVNMFNSKLYIKNNTKLHNLYGPTEAAVDVTYFDCSADKELELIPIGKPIDNIIIYVLDKYDRLQPIGIPGELCISGIGVARGYLNRQELTNTKFIQDPFMQEKRMYRTGDLVKWLPDGNIEYLGRMDNQVKIRGYRIELGEIQAHLLKFDNVREAIVVVREDEKQDKMLCAYIVSNELIDITEIRKSMQNELPDYMIPTYIMKIDAIPLTHNGKIDRDSLPEPQGSLIREEEYEAPANEMEEELMKIWIDILGLERIGVNDNFFMMGGHSLKLMGLVSNIHKRMNIEVPLKELFIRPTIRGLAEFLIEADVNVYKMIEPVEEREYYTVSSAQKRMYILSQFHKEWTSYNTQMAVIMQGKFDVQKFEEAIKAIVKRHESFRTSFATIEDEIVQIIHEDVDFDIEYMEVSEEEASQIIGGFVRPFDLSKAPLLRVGLIKVKETEYIVVCDMHHIITDGVSHGIVLKEFAALYAGQTLPELRLQYRDFAHWQNSLFDSGAIDRQREYWKKQFENEIPVLNIPTDYPRPKVQSFEGSVITFNIDREITRKLRSLTVETSTTMHMVLLSILNMLLYKYTGQEDIVIGTGIVGRPHADLENIVGMFINMLAMRNYPKGVKTFKELVMEVKESSLKAYENQDYQFEMLVDSINARRDPSRNPIYDVMFTVQNMDVPDIALKDIEFKPYQFGHSKTHADLNILAYLREDSIVFNLEYCTKLFSQQTIEKLAQHFVNASRIAVNNPDALLSELAVMAEKEKNSIVYEFNNTEAEYPMDKTVSMLFEEQALLNPTNIALEYNDKTMTYKELNERSNQLAKLLRQRGVKQDSIVGIMLEQSIEFVVGVIAVLKAGGAYLPIDLEYPQERIDYMLEDSGVSILLTRSNVENEYNVEMIYLDNEDVYTGDTASLNSINSPEDLAYIIYTSGSTGKPKGVMVNHKGLVNYIHWANKVYVRGEKLDFPLYSSISFDLTVTSIYTPLIAGNRVVIYNSEDKVQLIRRIVEENKVGVVKLTPTHLRLLEDVDLSNSNIKRFIVGGEDLKVEVARHIHESSEGKIEIYNEYGPTETVVGCMIHKYDKEKDTRVSVPIGIPADNVQIYILDKNMKPVPSLVEGEMYISGDGVARGYLNRSELTEERFLENPFVDGKAMYKTGDIARRLHDGNIEFIGRADSQVKIRGYRIELTEIEKILMKDEDIEECIVSVIQESEIDSYICAYIISEIEQVESEIKERLEKELPVYMLPQYIMQLDSMPLTSNGKIDISNLPNPKEERMFEDDYIGARDTIEEKLTQIWIQVLNLETIGINDDFFDLGGHSLKATFLVNKIHKELNVEVPLGILFETPTIAELADYIREAEEDKYITIQPIEEMEYYPVSSAQKRMYITSLLKGAGTSYNTPMAIIAEGTLNKERFEEAVKGLIKRHEVLRTSFKIVDDVVVQKVHEDADINIEYIVDSEEKDNIVKNFVEPFDLSKAPILRVGLIKLEENKHIIVWDMHHIITDGVSLGILLKEFTELYEGNELPDLRIQYKDFAHWQNSLFSLGIIDKQKKYWEEKLKGDLPVLNMPTDFERPEVRSFEGDVVHFTINEELTLGLKDLASESTGTMQMLLLSAFNILLYKYTGQSDIIVGTATAGRQHADLENLIGMFVNMLAMRNYPEGDKSFKEFLQEVKQTSLGAYENQDYPFEMLLDNIKIIRDLGRNPVYDVMFTVQNVSMPDIELSEIEYKPYNTGHTTSHADLNLMALVGDNHVIFSLEYLTKLFKRTTIERMSEHFRNIIKVIINNPDIKLAEIDIISEQEKKELLTIANHTRNSGANKNKTTENKKQKVKNVEFDF